MITVSEAHMIYQSAGGEFGKAVFGKMMTEVFGNCKQKKVIAGQRIYPL